MPNSVTNIESVAFAGCAELTDITMDKSVTGIGQYAFRGCTRLVGIYFVGNAPGADDSTALEDDDLTVYYLPGTAGWGPMFAGRPAVPWKPRIQSGDTSFGLQILMIA